MTARVIWLSRVVLGFATLIFFLIGFKYVLDPVSAAASSGMSLPTALGLTNMRAGVGGFPSVVPSLRPRVWCRASA